MVKMEDIEYPKREWIIKYDKHSDVGFKLAGYKEESYLCDYRYTDHLEGEDPPCLYLICDHPKFREKQPYRRCSFNNCPINYTKKLEI